MARVKIRGAVFELRYDVSTIEAIEDEFGTMEAMREAMKGSSVKNLRKMFQIMVNSARDMRGQAPMTPQDAKDILAHATLWELKRLSEAFTQALEEGMKSETTGGNEADSEEVDEVLEELERKNARAGDQPGRGNTTDTL